MYQNNSDLSRISMLLTSPDIEDYNLALNILQQRKMCAHELEKIIEMLNNSKTEYRFFMESCSVKRIPAKRT